MKGILHIVRVLLFFHEGEVSPNSDSKSKFSLSYGFMSHGFISKKHGGWAVFNGEWSFFAPGLFLTYFSTSCHVTSK